MENRLRTLKFLRARFDSMERKNTQQFEPAPWTFFPGSYVSAAILQHLCSTEVANLDLLIRGRYPLREILSGQQLDRQDPVAVVAVGQALRLLPKRAAGTKSGT